MAIESIFIVGLWFKNVDARAGMTAVVIGVAIYGFFPSFGRLFRVFI